MSNQSYAAYLTQITSSFNTYFVLTSSFIGIPCNFLSVGIFWRLRRQKTNMGFLCGCQAAVDAFLLITMFFIIRPPSVFFSYNLPIQSDLSCRFMTFLRRFVLHISSWMPVLITFDRLTFVLYGHSQRFKFMKSKLFLFGLILSMFVVIAIADIPNLFFYLSTAANPSCTGSTGTVISSDIISIILRTYAPFVIMIICNVFMLGKILKKAAFKQSSLNKRENQFTLAIMAFDVYFFLTNFPLSIFYILYDINLYTGSLRAGVADPLFVATYSLLNAICVNLSFVEQTLSFFMNLAFNKLFRREIMVIVGKVLPIVARFNRIQPSKTQTLSPVTNF